MEMNQYQSDGFSLRESATAGSAFYRFGGPDVSGGNNVGVSFMSRDHESWFGSDEQGDEAVEDVGGGGGGGIVVKTEPLEMLMSSGSSSFEHSMQDGDVDCVTKSNCIDGGDQQSQLQQSFVPCRVCSDKASGYHYGVTSCEGCKGFFRRSMQKQMEYRCLRDGKCTVQRLNRNRCQFCRFQKCIAVGMSRDSVRYGRVPKRSLSTDSQQQQQQQHAVSTTVNDGQLNHSDPVHPDSSAADDDRALAAEAAALAIENHQIALFDVILSVSHSHTAHCDVTEDKVMNIVKREASLISCPSVNSNVLRLAEKADMCRCIMFENVTALITPSINKVVEFAKRIPDFQRLSQEDQLILIRCGFYEIWLTRMARLFNIVPDCLLFSDGSLIKRVELETVYGVNFIEAVFDFAHNFKQLGLNDTEVGLVTSIILTSTDRPCLVNTQAVGKLRDKLSEALQLQLSRNHPQQPHLFQAIWARLPELKILSSAHDLQLHWYRAHWLYLSVPPLFAEIYDIAREEDIGDDVDDEEETLPPNSGALTDNGAVAM